MKPVAIDDFTRLKFLSEINFAPDGSAPVCCSSLRITSVVIPVYIISFLHRSI